MFWSDEGYLLSKTNYNENSIIIEAFTLNHGKYSGIVYGGSSKSKKRIFQIGNKISLNWKSKSVNRNGYFDVELINPISPKYFDDKKRSICIISALSILRILLPERQINKKIYNSFDIFLNSVHLNNWMRLYVLWELSLVKELGFEINISNKLNKSIFINGKTLKIPSMLLNHESEVFSNVDIKMALLFNKNVILENFIQPNNLRFPLSRNILEKYFD
jgi:DNA repair protein RecO (recombination protein O)